MIPAIALVALFISAWGGSSAEPSAGPTATPTEVDGGEWGQRAGLLEPNPELVVAESNGKLYLLSGYPSSRLTVRTVQIYDIASDKWQLGPPLPELNNHGMAASVNGKNYLTGGQTTADGDSYVDTVYELDPASLIWVTGGGTDIGGAHASNHNQVFRPTVSYE